MTICLGIMVPDFPPTAAVDRIGSCDDPHDDIAMLLHLMMAVHAA